MCQATIKLTGIFVLMEKGRVKCIDEKKCLIMLDLLRRRSENELLKAKTYRAKKPPRTVGLFGSHSGSQLEPPFYMNVTIYQMNFS